MFFPVKKIIIENIPACNRCDFFYAVPGSYLCKVCLRKGYKSFWSRVNNAEEILLTKLVS